MVSKTFLKNSFIYTIAGALPMASAIILLPFYTLHLSTEVLGALWIYLAFTLLVQIIITFSYDSSIYIHYHDFKSDEKKLSLFISSAFVFILIIGLAVIGVLSLTGDFIFDFVFSDGKITFYPYGLIALFTALFQVAFKVYSSLLQTRQKPKLFFRSNLLNFSLIASFTILGLLLYPNSLMGPIGGRLLAAIVSGGWSFGRVFTEFGFHFRYSILRAAFNFNFYAFIYQLQQWIINYFDRIVISLFLTLDQVGIYGFAVSCLLILDFVLNGLYNSFAPIIISIIADQKEKRSTPEVNRYFYGLTVVSMLLVSLCIMLYPILIDLFISKPEYKLSVQYVPYVAIIYLFKGMRLYFGIPYGILKYTKPLPVIYLVVAGVKIGGMFLLIREFGIYGVILSSLLAFCIEVLLLYLNGNKKLAYNFNIFKMLVAPVALAVFIFIVEFSIGNIYPFFVHAFYVGLCVTLIAWAFRNEMQLINNSLRKIK